MSQYDFNNVPDFISLDDESLFCLSIAHAWLNVFPAALRTHVRLKLHNLHRSLDSKTISNYGLVSGAYIGFTPIATTYRRFITHAERTNKREGGAQPAEFRKDPVARENSAASQYGITRGEMKRLYERLDVFAMEFAGIASYEAIFDCRQEILCDQSPFAPADRETYAEGPLHLWDFAKAVKEHDLVDMFFDTFNGWVLFVHRAKDVVFGQAIYPPAHRFGNFPKDPPIDIDGIRCGGGPSYILDVPKEVQDALKILAYRHFPEHIFGFLPPPTIFLGEVYRSPPIRLGPYPSGTEG